MKVRKHILLTSLLLISSASIFSQNKVTLESIHSSDPIEIKSPVLMDSTNLKGDKFADSTLLRTQVTLPSIEKCYIETYADSTQYIYLPKAEKNYQMQFLSFNVSANKYSSANLSISAPSTFEIYVDGKLETSKKTIEKDFSAAKTAKKNIELLPNISKRVLIKYLSSSKNETPEGIKITLESVNKNAKVDYTINNNAQRSATILDIMEGARVIDSRISPDGKYVFLHYKSVEKGGKLRFYTELINTSSHQITTIGERYPHWMPKSNYYYYTEMRGTKRNLITVDPKDGSTSILVEDMPEGSFRFSPSEKYMISQEKESFDERKGDLKRVLAPDDRQEGYLDRYYIHKYDLETGAKQRLTYGKSSTYLNDISQDSRYILFSVPKETITERPFRKNSTYRLNLETMIVDTLWTDQAFVSSAKFSPNGKGVLIKGAPEAFDGIGLNIKEGQIANSYDGQAFLMDIESKEIEAISKDFDPSIKSLYWNKADEMIYLTAVDKDCDRVYRYNPTRKTFTQLELNEDVISSISLANNDAKLSYIGMSASNSAKAYTFEMKKLKNTLISDPTKETFDNLALGEVTDWNFESSDGTTIYGRYYLPADFDESKQYPMIVYYYGGTTPTSRIFDHPYSMHVYAAMGYVVYAIQPSGTIGFGQEFSARHVNAWGQRTADDIIEGVTKFAEEHSFINKKKIGCIGASYGGFMTQYLQTKTNIFAAAVSHAGISSISSYWGEGYWGYSYSSGASAHSYPWNNKKMYVEQSPLFNADKIHTPILLLHGTEDTNVPIGESIQLYTALKILGRPVEFIQVKGENHGIAKYERRLAWNQSIYSWFAKWLQDDPEWWNKLYPKNK